METKKFSRKKNENEFSESMLESVYLFPDDAAHLLRHSIVHSARFTEPKDFTFGDWFENNLNPTRWIEVEPMQHIRNYDCLIYSHPKYVEIQSKDAATKKESIIIKKGMWLLGFEPRFSRPQREVLTTRRYPHS